MTTTTSPPEFSPLNPFGVYARIYTLNLSTGEAEEITTGSVTGFLATSDDPEAAAADGTLSMTASYVAGKGWLVAFAASVMTVELLDALFLYHPAWLIVQKSNGARVALELKYTRSRLMEAA